MREVLDYDGSADDTIGKEVPGLSMDALRQSRDAIFTNHRTGIPHSEYLHKLDLAYAPIELQDYAQPRNFVDALRIIDFMQEMHQGLVEATSPGERSNRGIVIACGQGRLLEVIAEAARILGITHLTFVDILERHIDMTRQKAKNLYGNRYKSAPVKLSFVHKDIIDYEPPYSNDMLLNEWYGSNEMLRISSPQELRTHRRRLYDALNDLLVTGGSLYETTPDPNRPGYYHTGVERTTRVLQEKSVLYGEHERFLLSNWAVEDDQPDVGQSFPHQIRLVQMFDDERNEKGSAGFKYTHSAPAQNPETAYVDDRTVLSALEKTGNIKDTKNEMRACSGLVTYPSPDVTQAIKYMRSTIWSKIE